MTSYKTVFFVVGMLLVILGLFMIFPIIAYGDPILRQECDVIENNNDLPPPANLLARYRPLPGVVAQDVSAFHCFCVPLRPQTYRFPGDYFVVYTNSSIWIRMHLNPLRIPLCLWGRGLVGLGQAGGAMWQFPKLLGGPLFGVRTNYCPEIAGAIR